MLPSRGGPRGYWYRTARPASAGLRDTSRPAIPARKVGSHTSGMSVAMWVDSAALGSEMDTSAVVERAQHHVAAVRIGHQVKMLQILGPFLAAVYLDYAVMAACGAAVARHVGNSGFDVGRADCHRDILLNEARRTASLPLIADGGWCGNACRSRASRLRFASPIGVFVEWRRDVFARLERYMALVDVVSQRSGIVRCCAEPALLFDRYASCPRQRATKAVHADGEKARNN
jgi:hypothetical protein